MTRKRPTTDLAVLRTSAAVNFTHPDRIANSMSREPLKLARITFGNVQRKGSEVASFLPSRGVRC